ncbi:uncharacterized protein [Amphiura filiformis]|uniref:uncharacterized protein isoform X2 n=1 Tax=Amphiura filiformis TaxID=82378 RepID=UPI003B20DC74
MGKKNTRKPPPPKKTGLNHQHLIDFYQSPPDDGKLKNGHVLFIYCQNGKSVAKTVRAVCPILPPACTTNANHVRTLGTNYERFKKPSQETERRNFVHFCDRQFNFIQATVASCPLEGVEQPASSSEEHDVQCLLQPNIMSSGKDLAVEGRVDRLHLTVIGGAGKFLCFTVCVQDSWIIHVTDGIDVWKVDLDATSLNAHRELSEVTSYEAYFARFRHAFSIGDVVVTKQAHKLCIDVGTGSTALKYDLYECTASERKGALQRALFWLAEIAATTGKKLTECEDELATLRKQKGTASVSAMMPGGKWPKGLNLNSRFQFLVWGAAANHEADINSRSSPRG